MGATAFYLLILQKYINSKQKFITNKQKDLMKKHDIKQCLKLIRKYLLDY